MKVKFSPLVASMSGTAADAVMASWKGIQYVRKHVIPHNPQTTAQMAVRMALARCVTLWRSLSADQKAWLDTYGVDYRLSGFNVFIQKSRALEQAEALLKPVPDNPHEDAPGTFAAVTGVGIAGDIDVSWVDNSTGPFQKIYLLTRKSGSNVFAPALFPTAADETFTIPGLTAGADYDVYGFFFDHNNIEFGTSAGVLDVAAMA